MYYAGLELYSLSLLLIKHFSFLRGISSSYRSLSVCVCVCERSRERTHFLTAVRLPCPRAHRLRYGVPLWLKRQKKKFQFHLLFLSPTVKSFIHQSPSARGDGVHHSPPPGGGMAQAAGIQVVLSRFLLR